ncbi:Protein of unknown function [Cotesia congregata]|uniref:Uncharacterized protein n=1 Tax=Cotesia congregata TaxID=51543 RepID=A0A8J2HAC7_COTCN|nr:Protein of unknown function [Cotesia congregata]
MPESIKIGERLEYKNIDGSNHLVPVNIFAEKIPLAQLLKVFFQSSDILKETLEFMRLLECEINIISTLWKKQRSLFTEKIVFPLFLFFDEFETNNPLGSHKGINKCGAVYINLPNIPPQYKSKLENIFLYYDV